MHNVTFLLKNFLTVTVGLGSFCSRLLLFWFPWQLNDAIGGDRDEPATGEFVKSHAKTLSTILFIIQG